MSTTIFNLRVKPESDFDQPDTFKAAFWKAAIVYISEGGKWNKIVWGRHIECPEAVHLMIEWKSPKIAREFLKSDYEDFVGQLSILLQDEPKFASVANLDCSLCEPASTLLGEQMTTVYRIPFSTVSGSQENEVGQLLSKYGAKLESDKAEGFLDSRWALSTPFPKSSKPARTLFFIARWRSKEAEQEAEQEAEKTSTHDVFDRTLLQKADPGWEKYHIEWSVLLPQNLGRWKVSQ